MVRLVANIQATIVKMQFKLLFTFALFALCSARPHHSNYNEAAQQVAASVSQSVQSPAESAVIQESASAPIAVAQSVAQSVAQEAQSPAASDSFAVKSVKAQQQAPQEPAGIKSTSVGAKSTIKSPAKVASEIAAAPASPSSSSAIASGATSAASASLAYSAATELHAENLVHAETENVPVAKSPVVEQIKPEVIAPIEHVAVHHIQPAAAVAAAVIAHPTETFAAIKEVSENKVVEAKPIVEEAIAHVAPTVTHTKIESAAPIVAASVSHPTVESAKIVEPVHKEIAPIAEAPVVPSVGVESKPIASKVIAEKPVVEAAAPVAPVESIVTAEVKPEEKPIHYSAAIVKEAAPCHDEIKPAEESKAHPIESIASAVDAVAAAPVDPIKTYDTPVESGKPVEFKPVESVPVIDAKPSVYSAVAEPLIKPTPENKVIAEKPHESPVVAHSVVEAAAPVKPTEVAAPVVPVHSIESKPTIVHVAPITV